MVLTARADNHLYGVDDLEDTITRLTAYRQAGADVVYGPWLADMGIRRVVTETASPVNVLARATGPVFPSSPTSVSAASRPAEPWLLLRTGR